MINKTILVGRVGKDPETRNLGESSKVSKFSLATSESYKDKQGQKVETTEWHNIVVWNGLADVVEKYVRKGSLLYVEGKIKYGSYDDKDGNKKYTTDIVVNNLQMLGGKSDEPEQNGFDNAGGNPGYKGDTFP